MRITLTQKSHPDKPITAMTKSELYEAGRHAWVLGSAADRERYVLIVFNNTVLQAIDIDRLEDVIVTTAKGKKQQRRAIQGTVLAAGHPVYDTFVGKAAPSIQHPESDQVRRDRVRHHALPVRLRGARASLRSTLLKQP
jgi:hypothetical protein